ncbi:MAG: hypothetical protein K6F61_04055 [Clostridiales bacterium]|nr:hypothetical protein [Clostridiales bacterium]
MAAPQTICWDCRNAIEKGCEWANNYEPVEGWDAEESSKKGAGRTYIVHSCPKFVRDSWHYGNYRTEEEYNKYLQRKEENRLKKEARERRKLEEAIKTIESNGMKIKEEENDDE